MDNERLQKIKRVNEVSSCFCLAKWLQVTIDLQNGQTHSCHHPGRHTIPLAELETNPSALHNTNFKKEQRKKMLEGTRPEECDYCWNIEDLGENDVSDRMIKSLDYWAFDKLEKVKDAPWDENIVPTYLEVMFENTCNLGCMYCSAQVSSKLNNELKQFGSYSWEVPHHGMEYIEYPAQEDNPYIKAFWKWLPDIIDELKVLRVTGGEPLLSKNLYLLLDYLDANPNKKLRFAVNSNLSLPSERFKKFALKIRQLLDQEKIEAFELYVSIDTFEEQAEYIRSGLSFEKFSKNMKIVHDILPEVHITIMCTFNVLSIPKFGEFIDLVAEWKRVHKSLMLDISYLNHPRYLSPNIITEDFHNLVRSYVEKIGTTPGFFDYEVDKMRRLYHYILSKDNEIDERRKFAIFIEEYDRRHGRNFSEIFPTMDRFYKECKLIAVRHKP